MKSTTTGTGLHLPIVIGIVLLLVMLFLLYMSGQTGQREFDDAQSRLDGVQILNLRLDAAMFPLLFEVQVTYDELTDLQAELRESVADYARHVNVPSAPRLSEMTHRKLALIEDFKTELPVQRNSRMIAEQMLEELRTGMEAFDSGDRQYLAEVERAFLEFLTRRDALAVERLSLVLRDADEAAPQVLSTSGWEVLRTHVANIAASAQRMLETTQLVWMVPMPQVLRDNHDELNRELAAANVSATNYRRALFAVAVLLLAFSAWKVVEVRRYMRLLQSANETLEARVDRRTAALARANEALRGEISQREEVEMQLRLAQKLEAIGHLAAGIAHEINTPAQYVSDNVSFFATAWEDLEPVLARFEASLGDGGSGDPPAAKLWEAADVDYLRTEMPIALEQARAGLRQIADIVLAIKSFSHPGKGRKQAVDLNAAITNVTVVARNEWKYVAELTMDLEESLPPVLCDPSSVNQALLNLIVNAAQALTADKTRDGFGHIRVTSRREGELAVICVDDDGPGVPEAIRDRIFDPFFTTKDVGEGSGQGLAIAHRVAVEHGGLLRLDTPPGGRGARFCLSLPLAGGGRDEDEVAGTSAGGTASTATSVQP